MQHYTQDQQFTRAYMEFVVMHNGQLQRVRSPWLTLQICDMIFCSRQGLSSLGFLENKGSPQGNGGHKNF